MKLGKIKKITGLLCSPKILNQLSQPKANQVTCKVLSLVKDPSNYEGRTVHKNEQKPIELNIDNGKRSTTVVKPNEIKRVEKRKLLEKQLSENAIKMKNIKSNKL